MINLINLVYIYKATKTMIQMNCIIFMILPPWTVFLSLSITLCPSADSAYGIVSTNSKQVLKESAANTELLYFSGQFFLRIPGGLSF